MKKTTKTAILVTVLVIATITIMSFLTPRSLYENLYIGSSKDSIIERDNELILKKIRNMPTEDVKNLINKKYAAFVAADLPMYEGRKPTIDEYLHELVRIYSSFEDMTNEEFDKTTLPFLNPKEAANFAHFGKDRVAEVVIHLATRYRAEVLDKN